MESEMIEKFKQEFMVGFHEGWSEFWSPFTALYAAIRKSFDAHVAEGSSKSA